jgi:hypothetical protein
MSGSEVQLKALYEDAHRAQEMLQFDKTFLQKEVAEYVSKVHQSERVIDSQAAKISQLEAKVPPSSSWILTLSPLDSCWSSQIK